MTFLKEVSNERARAKVGRRFWRRRKEGFLKRLLLLILLPIAVHAQGSRFSGVALNSNGTPLPLATITVCAAGASGTPCSPTSALCTDIACATQTASNPVTADAIGNFFFYALPGRYEYQVTGPGVSTPLQINDLILSCDPTNSCNPSSAGTFTGSAFKSNFMSSVNGLTNSGGQGPLQEAVTGAIAVPSTATIHQADAVAGYVTNVSSGMDGGGAVAGYFQADARANNANVWGINPLCNVDPSLSLNPNLAHCTAGEFDVNNETDTDWIVRTGTGVLDRIDIISGGPNKPRYALVTSATLGASNAFQYGIGVLNYAHLGLQVGGPSGSLVAGAQGATFYASDTSAGTPLILLASPSGTTLDLFDDTGAFHTNNIIAIGAQNVSGCGLTNAAGGSWAGSFKSGTAGTCTVTITPGPTAPNGFVCQAWDITTAADTVKQTAYTTTTCTISGTTASSDVITWTATAF